MTFGFIDCDILIKIQFSSEYLEVQKNLDNWKFCSPQFLNTDHFPSPLQKLCRSSSFWSQWDTTEYENQLNLDKVWEDFRTLDWSQKLKNTSTILITLILLIKYLQKKINQTTSQGKIMSTFKIRYIFCIY